LLLSAKAAEPPIRPTPKMTSFFKVLSISIIYLMQNCSILKRITWAAAHQFDGEKVDQVNSVIILVKSEGK
jgi:hypothetical protein